MHRRAGGVPTLRTRPPRGDSGRSLTASEYSTGSASPVSSPHSHTHSVERTPTATATGDDSFADVLTPTTVPPPPPSLRPIVAKTRLTDEDGIARLPSEHLRKARNLGKGVSVPSLWRVSLP